MIDEINSEKWHLPFVLLIFCAALISSANAFSFDFVCDDWPQIVENHKLRSAAYIADFFTKGVWANSQFEYADTSLYRPLFLLTNFLLYQLFGANGAAFHGFNILLHSVNCLLLFFLLCKLAKPYSAPIAAVTTMLYAVHPVHSEPVSWIAGSTDLLVTFFVLGSFLAFIKYIDTDSLIAAALSILSYLCALLSKEAALLLPLCFPLYCQLTGRKIRWPHLLSSLGVMALYFVARTTALGDSSQTLAFSGDGLKNFFLYVAGYAKYLLIPWPTQYGFALPADRIIGLPGITIGLLLLSGILFVVYRYRALMLFAFVWMVIFLAPPLALAFHIDTPVFAGRFLYLPGIGAIILFYELLRKKIKTGSKPFFAAAGALILLLGTVSIITNQRWQNDETFYRWALSSNPEHAGFIIGLAGYMERTSRTEEALTLYQRAAGSSDDDARLSAHLEMAFIYGRQQKNFASINHLKQAFEIDPNNRDVLNGLGNNYLVLRNLPLAIQYYQLSLAQRNDQPETLYNLAMSFQMAGNMDEAKRYYRLFLENASQELHGALIAQVRNLLNLQ